MIRTCSSFTFFLRSILPASVEANQNFRQLDPYIRRLDNESLYDSSRRSNSIVLTPFTYCIFFFAALGFVNCYKQCTETSEVTRVGYQSIEIVNVVTNSAMHRVS